MRAVEFETVLTGKKSLVIPRQAAKRLPVSGRAKVIVLYDDGGDDSESWRLAAYEQFAGEDTTEDAIYDQFAKNR